MHDIAKLPRQHHQALVSYVKGLATDVEPTTGIGSFTYSTPSGVILIQIVAAPVVDGERVVLHFLPPDGPAEALTDLGFWGDGRAALEHALCQPHGLILSGSIDRLSVSCVSASIIGALQAVQHQVVDINPPAEPTIEGINQLPISDQTQLAERLSWALQQDGDVIAIGHLTDRAAVSMAFESALNHKLLLGTVSAASVARALRRLLDTGAETHLIAAGLRLATIEKPVRRLCPNCRETYKPPKTTWPRVAKAIGTTEVELYAQLHKLELQAQKELGPDLTDLSSSPKSINRLWKASPVGCQNCHFTGYRGNLYLTEVLEMTPTVQRAIVLNQPVGQLQTTIRQTGTISLELDGLVKALRGLTTLEEIVGRRYR